MTSNKLGISRPSARSTDTFDAKAIHSFAKTDGKTYLARVRQAGYARQKW
ncbi:uncharacterized protein METZ01_LOCUS325598 [marine metagenome]|uniref:Uncharacterized protein n=1 Tax=marine metagenome TaxID=408172 RepID=A0A382PH78_9ZZZZ